MGPPAPDEIVDMWSLTPLADGTLDGVERELRAAGLRVAGAVHRRDEESGVRAAKAHRDSKRRAAKRLRKGTNTHLMGLFEDGGAAAGEAAVAGPGAQAHR